MVNTLMIDYLCDKTVNLNTMTMYNLFYDILTQQTFKCVKTCSKILSLHYDPIINT